MNTLKKFSLFILAGLFFTACQNDDEAVVNQAGQLQEGERTPVTFELDASIITPNGPSLKASRVMAPTYSTDGFSVYAFRKSGDDYIYSETISLADAKVENQGKKIKGTANLIVGEYKFVGAYGLRNSFSYTLPTWNTQALTNDLLINYVPQQGLANELFLETDKEESTIRNYDFTQGANETVSIALNRAVSRVDVMFISADKNEDGTYTEKAYTPGNIFNDFDIDQLELRFGGLNNAMNLFGIDKTQSKISQNVKLTNLNDRIVIGDGTASIIGEGYTRFDNVQTSDIITGAAHVFGTYLFPNKDAAKSTDLDIFISSTNGVERTIPISIDDDHKLPLERNKVTLVKVYVLNGNHVFSTTVDFEVEIETVWEDPNEVSGEIK